MPANRKAVLDDAQRKILRWDEQEAFLSRSVPSTIGQADIDTEMFDIWTEFVS
jgi:spermidine/putrescine transport system substrate-binding protein